MELYIIGPNIQLYIISLRLYIIRCLYPGYLSCEYRNYIHVIVVVLGVTIDYRNSGQNSYEGHRLNAINLEEPISSGYPAQTGLIHFSVIQSVSKG